MTITTRDAVAAERFYELARVEFARLGYSPLQYRRRDRHRSLAYARAEVAWILRNLDPRPSFPLIARCVGLGDHASVMYAVKQHARRMAAPGQPGPHNVNHNENIGGM